MILVFSEFGHVSTLSATDVLPFFIDSGGSIWIIYLAFTCKGRNGKKICIGTVLLASSIHLIQNVLAFVAIVTDT
jgi:hypothetical protein